MNSHKDDEIKSCQSDEVVSVPVIDVHYCPWTEPDLQWNSLPPSSCPITEYKAPRSQRTSPECCAVQNV